MLQRAGADGCALHAAVQGGHATLARDLVEGGASVTRKDQDGDCPLHLAAAMELGEEDTVSFLLEKGAPPNALNSAGRAPLHMAAVNGRLAAVNALLAAGADTSLRSKQEDASALDFAAVKGRVDIVAALIRGGANVNTVDTALHKAARSNEVGVIDVLAEAGADMDVREGMQGWVPLHCASGDARCFEALVALLKKGAGVNKLDNEGRSPLHTAVDRGHLRATKALLAAGADVSFGDYCFRSSALHLAATHWQNLSTVLVQAGADVNATDVNGDTPLHSSAVAWEQWEDDGIFHVLIEAGATVDARNRIGRTPLHVICASRSGGMLLGPTSYSSTYCAEYMDTLLECGADPNAQDRYGNTPLHLLATRKRSMGDTGDDVDLLLRWGADEMATNVNGRTPLEGAEAKFGVNGLGRARDLLARAQVDRNWRRRGWLLMYRAYPRRMQRPIPGTGAAPRDRTKKKQCSARSVSTGEAAGDANAARGEAAATIACGGGSAPGDWNGVVTWVVGMELEGVFRNVVAYM